jgi:hypothetical protein
MRAGLSFSYPPISLLLRQPLSIKKSYAGAIHTLPTSSSNNNNFFLGGVSSTFRDSKTAPFAWREKLTMREVENIQVRYGYLPASYCGFLCIPCFFLLK